MLFLLVKICSIGAAVGVLLAIGSLLIDGRRDESRFSVRRMTTALALAGALGGGLAGAVVGVSPHAPWLFITLLGAGIGAVEGAVLGLGLGWARTFKASSKFA